MAIVAAIIVVLAMGTLTYKGATAKEALGSELKQAVPDWAEAQGFSDVATAVAGAEIFAQVGCANCHTYLGAGSSNLGAPDLSDVGASDRAPDYFAELRLQPGQVREHRDAAVRGARRGESGPARRLPRRLQGPEGLVP